MVDSSSRSLQVNAIWGIAGEFLGIIDIQHKHENIYAALGIVGEAQKSDPRPPWARSFSGRRGPLST